MLSYAKAYLYLKDTKEKIIILRRGEAMDGSKAYLAYVGMTFDEKGQPNDFYGVPLDNVTEEMLAEFIKTFKRMHRIGRFYE